MSAEQDGPVMIKANVPEAPLLHDWKPRPQLHGSVWQAVREGVLLDVRRAKEGSQWFAASLGGITLNGSYVSPLCAMSALEEIWRQRITSRNRLSRIKRVRL